MQVSHIQYRTQLTTAQEFAVTPPSSLTKKEEIYDYIRQTCECAITKHHRLFFDIQPDIRQKIDTYEVLDFCTLILTQYLYSCDRNSHIYSSPSPSPEQGREEDDVDSSESE